jgi:transposase
VLNCYQRGIHERLFPSRSAGAFPSSSPPSECPTQTATGTGGAQDPGCRRAAPAGRIARYGKRSETLSDLQLKLLDLEPGVSSEEVAAESEREPVPPATEDKQAESANKPQAAPGRKHPGRQKLPSHLGRVEQVVPCTGGQCQCTQCGARTQVIGYEETEVLDVRPAEYFVTVIKREKRACAECPGQGVSTAPAPERTVAKSLLSDQVIIDLVVKKYCESLPLYRQQAVLRRDGGVEIARSTLDDAVMRVGELLLPIAQR